MTKKIGPRVYFVILLILIIIVLSALVFLRGAIIGYFTAAPGAEKVDVGEIASSKGITYINKEVIDKFSKKDESRVIIKFRGGVKELGLSEGEFGKKRESGSFLSGTLKRDGLLKLMYSLENEVELIQVDHQLISTLGETVPLIGADLVWDLGFTGKSQTVCVIDTGIDYNHENLSGKYIGGYDFVNDDPDPMDDHGHGTYVSGIVAGIAPDAKIVAVKALGNDGIGYESDIIAAIDYCIENKDLYKISVMLLALGGGSFDGYCDAVLVTDESNYAAQQGMFVVAASGNDHSSNLTAPACGTNVTSVAATTKNDTFYPDNNINPLLDVLAPGVNITSTKLGGGFRIGSGTSASAAVVAGAAALILENESLEPMDLNYRLRATGFLIEHEGANYSRIDVYNALLNNVTNTPSEQVGNQSEGNWEEYKPLGNCECNTNGDCGGGNYCCKWQYWGGCEECTATMDYQLGLCVSCLGETQDCGGEGDPGCCGYTCTYD